MEDYIEVQYNKLTQCLIDSGLQNKYFLKIERTSIEIYDSENKFVYGSNDMNELKENINFLKLKEEKREKNKSSN